MENKFDNTLKAKVGDIDIPENEPFKNDGFEREKFAQTMSKFLNNFKQGAVVALNGAWGTGKTTFVKMWMQSLKNEGYPVVYYNAWEDDISEEPLFSMIKGLGDLSKEDSKFDSLVGKAAKVIVGGLFGALKGIAGVWGNAAEGAIKGCAEQLEKDCIASLKSNDNTTSLLLEFREELKDFTSFVCDSKPQMVYFIDELDRCNPTFAVKVLERIKHLFEVPNIVFVLSVDKKQLCNSINGYFGSDKIDSEEYLRRFIEVEFCLPEPAPESVCYYFANRFGVKRLLPQAKTSIEFSEPLSTIKLLLRYKHLSLRKAERIFGLVSAVVLQFDVDENKVSNVFNELTDLYFFIAYLKVCEYDKYEKIKLLQYSLQELCDDLNEIIPHHMQTESLKYQLNVLSITLIRLLCCYLQDLNDFCFKTKIAEKIQFNVNPGNELAFCKDVMAGGQCIGELRTFGVKENEKGEMQVVEITDEKIKKIKVELLNNVKKLDLKKINFNVMVKVNKSKKAMYEAGINKGLRAIFEKMEIIGESILF